MRQKGLAGLYEFLAVAQNGGLNAASRDSGIPKATLARHVKDLETALGTRLLERDGRNLRLSDEGKFLYQRAGPLLAELDGLRDQVAGRNEVPSGKLKMSVPALFARDMLGEVLADLVARYPEVSVEVDVNDSVVNPVRDGYDLVVRTNPAPDSELVGRRFLTTDMVLAAPPEMKAPAADGEKIRAVVLKAQSELREWTAISNERELRMIPVPVVVCSSMMVVHQAARSGAGAALLPRTLVMEDLAQGRLRLWGTVPNRQIEAWVLHSSSRLTSPKVRVFLDLLVAAFREHSAKTT